MPSSSAYLGQNTTLFHKNGIKRPDDIKLNYTFLYEPSGHYRSKYACLSAVAGAVPEGPTKFDPRPFDLLDFLLFLKHSPLLGF